jgi:hypothetical protein
MRPNSPRLTSRDAKARGQHAVEGRRRAAALRVAEHGAPHLALQPRLQRPLQPLGGATQAQGVGAAGQVGAHRQALAGSVRALGDADQRRQALRLARALHKSATASTL